MKSFADEEADGYEKFSNILHNSLCICNYYIRNFSMHKF